VYTIAPLVAAILGKSINPWQNKGSSVAGAQQQESVEGVAQRENAIHTCSFIIQRLAVLLQPLHETQITQIEEANPVFAPPVFHSGLQPGLVTIK
jgi:hypothetical protein